MSSVKLYPPQKGTSRSNALPQLLQTPSGLALLELQGSINLPADSDSSGFDIGKLDFPDYNPDAEGSAWMKRVHLYVGQHQRLTGEVKKLTKAIAVVRWKEDQGEEEGGGDDLEVVEIVKFKLMFSNRPEPVGTANAT